MRMQGELAVLRPVRMRDLVFIRRWDEDPEVSKFTRGKPGEICCKTNAVASRLRKITRAITTRDGVLIGHVELDDIRWSAGIGELKMCIGMPEYWGKGYGTEALGLFVDFLFENTRIRQIYLRVYRHNVRAVRCYENCGFMAEAYLLAGSRSATGFEDLVLMRLDRETHELWITRGSLDIMGEIAQDNQNGKAKTGRSRRARPSEKGAQRL